MAMRNYFWSPILPEFRLCLHFFDSWYFDEYSQRLTTPFWMATATPFSSIIRFRSKLAISVTKWQKKTSFCSVYSVIKAFVYFSTWGIKKRQIFFTSFSPKFFLTIFLVKSKLSTAKKPKTTTFSRVFHSEKSTIFLENQSWIFGQKMKISNSVA